MTDTGCMRRALARPKRKPWHPVDDETREAAILRSIGNRDWEVLTREEVESLEGFLNSSKQHRGSELHNVLREKLGLAPVYNWSFDDD